MPKIRAILDAMSKETDGEKAKNSSPVTGTVSKEAMIKAVDDYRKQQKIGKYSDGN